jgi:hypothetical protein
MKIIIMVICWIGNNNAYYLRVCRFGLRVDGQGSIINMCEEAQRNSVLYNTTV